MRAVALASALLALAPASICAGPQRAISESRALELLTDERITHAAKNLRDMADASGEREKTTLQKIASLADDSETAVGHFLEVAIIYQQMTSAGDKAKVLKWLPTDLANADHVLGYSVIGVNRYLTLLTSPAALAEAQRLRDRMQELRDELGHYQY